MDRYWLLTWTTYGTWLPGDRRGFVSPVRDGPGPEVRHNMPAAPLDADLPGLERTARSTLKGDPVRLQAQQAAAVFEQFQETAGFRHWLLLAVAVMTNHVHVVVGVPGDPEPDGLLRDFKSYASRRLNRRWQRPGSGTWWTESGSRRVLRGEPAVVAAMAYVKEQEHPLLVWTAPGYLPGERGASAP